MSIYLGIECLQTSDCVPLRIFCRYPHNGDVTVPITPFPLDEPFMCELEALSGLGPGFPLVSLRSMFHLNHWLCPSFPTIQKYKKKIKSAHGVQTSAKGIFKNFGFYFFFFFWRQNMIQIFLHNVNTSPFVQVLTDIKKILLNIRSVPCAIMSTRKPKSQKIHWKMGPLPIQDFFCYPEYGLDLSYIFNHFFLGQVPIHMQENHTKIS